MIADGCTTLLFCLVESGAMSIVTVALAFGTEALLQWAAQAIYHVTA